MKLGYNWMFKSKTNKITRTSTRTKPESSGYDHVITVNESENTATLTHDERYISRNRKVILIIDSLFCILVTFSWITAISFFVKFSISFQRDKLTIYEYLYFTCFIIIVLGIYLEFLILKNFEKLNPKIAVIIKRCQGRTKSYILRIRNATGLDRDFIEAQINEKELNYDKVMEVCCKELKLSKNEVARLRKVPETKIRNDEDVKRFRKLEYIEVIVR